MSSPAIQYSGPAISAEVPWEVRRHLQLIYQKLGNHTQAFSLQQQAISSLNKGAGSTTTIIEGGGSGPTPGSGSGIPVNNQSGVTTYAAATGDNGALIVLSDASPIAVSLTPQTPPWGCYIANQGSGTATLTPAVFGLLTPTISYAGNPGAASMPLLGGYGCLVAFDGANWWALTEPIVPVNTPAVSHEWFDAYDAATGAFSATQPDFTDISGTVGASQLPTPTSSTLGGVEAAGPTTSEWINEIDTFGVPHLSQPAFSDLSGTASAAQLPAGVPVVSFGSGAPSGTSTEGYIYFDVSGSPAHGYVYHSSAWVQFS